MPDTPPTPDVPQPAKPHLAIGRPVGPSDEQLDRLTDAMYEALQASINNGIPKPTKRTQSDDQQPE